MKKILLVLCLALLVSTQDSTFETCVDTCATTHCSADTADCDTPMEEFGDVLMSFDIEACTDYLYTAADDASTDQQVLTALVACFDAHAATYIGDNAYQGDFVGCFADCVEASPDEFDMDMGELQEGHVCMMECTETTTDCKHDSDCFGQYIKNPGLVMTLTVENDITSCDEMQGREGSPNFTDAQFSTLIETCYDAIATQITAANTATAGTYPDELAGVYSCVADCANEYGFEQSTYEESGPEGESDHEGHDHDDDDDHHDDDDYEDYEEYSDYEDCHDNYCLREFDMCLHKCDKECYDNDCLGNEYLSIIGSQACKDHILDMVELYESGTPVVDDDFLEKFELCGQAFETEYSDNQDILDHIQCYRECKEEPEWAKPNHDDDDDDDDGENSSILTIGLALILAIIIV